MTWQQSDNNDKVLLMKKILGILVLSFLFCTNANADFFQKCRVALDSDVRGNCTSGYGVIEYRGKDVYMGYWKDGKKHGKGKYIWKDGSVYEGEWYKNNMHGQGKFTHADGTVWQGEFRNDDFMGNKNANTNSTNNLDIGSLIEQAKGTCKSLGFKDGTEKFTDCSLKLYSQSLDLAAKNNQQIIVQNQGNSSDTIKVFDVVRDRENTMRKAKGLIDGSCTLANYVFC